MISTKTGYQKKPAYIIPFDLANEDAPKSKAATKLDR
jgi:hypothetical protein